LHLSTLVLLIFLIPASETPHHPPLQSQAAVGSSEEHIPNKGPSGCHRWRSGTTAWGYPGQSSKLPAEETHVGGDLLKPAYIL
jgi:hypothetical protein